MTSFFPRKKNITDIFRLLLVLLFFGLHSAGNQLEAQRPFVTVWDLSKPGSGSGQISFDIESTGAVNYDWETIPAGMSGSGTFFNDQGVVVSNLPSNARIRLRIQAPNLKRFYFFTFGGDVRRLMDVEQWGDVAWSSMALAFNECENLQISAADMPNLSNVSSFSSMFSGCKSLNGPANIASWNMSSAVNLYNMFAYADAFNQPIGSWNTSNVESMEAMFTLAVSFNQPLNNWNVSKVKTMEAMFAGAESFNQPLNQWSPGSVTNTRYMFYQATSFNQDLTNWNTSSLRNMEYMFYEARAFNGELNNWNTSAAENMEGMFRAAVAFNQPLSNWNTSNVTNTSWMFSGTPFNQPIGNWSTSKVTKMQWMFSYDSLFNQPLGNWSTNAVTQMDHMFLEARAFNQPIGNWNTSKVVNMQSMFEKASAFNQDINNWNTGNVTDFSAMFKDAVQFNQPLDNWDTRKATTMSDMFNNASAFNQELNTWDVSALEFAVAMFRNASQFNKPLNNWNTIALKSTIAMFGNAVLFNQDLSTWHTEGITSMLGMFFEAKSFNQPLGTWKLHPNVILNNLLSNSGLDCNNYDATLIGWSEQTDLPVSRTLGALGMEYWEAGNARSILVTPVGDGGKGWTISGDRRNNCNAGNPFVTRWDMITEGSSPDGLEFGIQTPDTVWYHWESVPPGFSGQGYWTDSNAKVIGLPMDRQIRLYIQPEGLDRFAVQDGPDRMRLKAVEQWGEARWKAMDYAFSGCENMDVIAGDVPDLSQTESVRYLFLQCKNLVGTPVMNDWDVSSIRRFDGMFDFAEKFNQPIQDWNTSKAESMAYMFQGASMFNQDISDWDVSKVTDFGGLFYEARAFNQPIGKWNTESARGMLAMFQGAESFDQPLDEWNVSSVTSMTSMFRNAKVFDGNISDWDVSNVEQMNHMFRGATNFNQNLNRWNTGSVVTMNAMFMQAERFNQPLDSWNTTRVENMGSMFNQAISFNQPVGGWNVGQVNDMSYMFSGADAFSQDLSSWRPAAVEDLSYMFSDNVLFNAPIGTWDVRQVKNFTGMLSGASSFDQNLGSWTFGEGTVLTSMLDNSGMSCENYDLSLKGWNRNADTPADLSLGAAGLTYWLGVEARDSLVIDKNWLIDGDTYDECDYASSIRENGTEVATFYLYPNPGSDHFSWSADNMEMLEVRDMYGRVIFHSESPSVPLETVAWKPGAYVVLAIIGGKPYRSHWLKH
jgi:surface protein